MKRLINQLLSQNIINRSKKTSVLLALLLTLATSFSFANGNDDITRQVKASFKQDFKNAQIISGEVHKKYTKLTFRMNDMVLFAFYSENGQLLAVVRNILSTQLPIDLQMELRKKYSDYWISELFELNGDGENYYYITLENADKKIILRSSAYDGWEVYNTVIKK